MDEQNSQPHMDTTPAAKVWAKWQRLSSPRKFLTAIVVLLALAIVLSLIRTTLFGGIHTNRVATYQSSGGGMMGMSAPAMKGMADVDMAYEESYEMADGMAYNMRAPSPTMPMPAPSGGAGAYDESAYETVSYNASIKTRRMNHACDSIEAWKPLEYVVFESTSRNEHACYYRFKVGHEYTEAVLVAIEQLDPDELTANIETVKKQMVRYDGQLAILLQKQEILQTTLNSSVDAYDELVALSKNAHDVETLSRVIDSKLAQIERLTRERTNLASQLQSLARQMADLEDRVAFTQFSVRVEKYEIIDNDAMKDSWVAALKNFAREVNRNVQGLTLGLILNLLALAQFLIYLLILLVLAKFGWRAVKHFWVS